MSTASRTTKDTNGPDAGNFAGDLDNLKDSFAQLRSDVTGLLSSAAEAGKSGASAVRNGAADVVGGLKNKGFESLEAVEQQMGEFPLRSALVAFGVGFVVARLINRR